jgi:hypothetical protein
VGREPCITYYTVSFGHTHDVSSELQIPIDLLITWSVEGAGLTEPTLEIFVDSPTRSADCAIGYCAYVAGKSNLEDFANVFNGLAADHGYATLSIQYTSNPDTFSTCDTEYTDLDCG